MLCCFHPTYSSPTVCQTQPKPPLPEGAGYQPMGHGAGVLLQVTSRTSFRTSAIRGPVPELERPSSSALRSCRATFFLQDSCRLKYFTSLLCPGETQRTEGQLVSEVLPRRTGRYLASVPSHPNSIQLYFKDPFSCSETQFPLMTQLCW